jgi:hypothetical protein
VVSGTLRSSKGSSPPLSITADTAIFYSDHTEVTPEEMKDFEAEVLPTSLEFIFKKEEGAWEEVTASAAAISFPSYMLADRVPRHFRGGSYDDPIYSGFVMRPACPTT